MKAVLLSEIIGKTMKSVALDKAQDRITFTSESGEEWLMHHDPDCCESVTVDDICGELDDLVGSPILQAEQSSSDQNPEGVTKEFQDSFTWTFYRFATAKGSVVIRWYGESNGYYSESVEFDRL